MEAVGLGGGQQGVVQINADCWGLLGTSGTSRDGWCCWWLMGAVGTDGAVAGCWEYWDY